MNKLSKEQKEIIIKKLAEKGVKASCPMCGNNHFVLADAYFTNILQTQLNSISIGGPNIPTIAIICSNCGFISQHALGSLGLLPKDDDIKKEEENKDEKK